MIQRRKTRRFFSKLFYAVFVLSAAIPLSASEPINLSGLDMYVRRGFDPSWTKAVPAADSQWQKFDGNP
ncbi:MAG: hypothetical protein ACRCUT_01325, partial [Spirochaetota bacterium]